MKKIKVERMDKNVYKRGDTIIIYGAGVFGEIALKVLRFLEIPTSYFCDQALSGREKFGISIIAPEELINHPKAKIIIASQNYYGQIKNNLQDMGYQHCYDMVSFFDYPINSNILSEQAKDMFQNSEKYRDAALFSGGDVLYIPHLEVTVTECCTLKCRYCATLSPYYKKPCNINLRECKMSLDKFLSEIDYLSELRLLGGEPFVNANLYEYVENYANSPKLGMVHIYTNGTIIPNEKNMDCLKHEKVKLHISDYGLNKDKINRLIQELNRNDIKYVIRKYDNWQNLGDFSDRNYSVKQKEVIFRDCIAKNCFTLIRNKLYRCSRIANADNSGLFLCPEIDRIQMDKDFRDGELKKQIINLLFERNYLSGCNFCSGMDCISNQIGVAEQL